MYPADDVRAEADHQQEGTRAAAGHGEPGQLPESAGHTERHDRSRRAQPDGSAGDLPTAPRAGLPSRHGQESWALEGPVGQRGSSSDPRPPHPSPTQLAGFQWPSLRVALQQQHTVRPLGAQSKPAHQAERGVILRLVCCPLGPEVGRSLSLLFCSSLRGGGI